jgi:hypothetical protein
MTSPEVEEGVNPNTGTGVGLIAFLDHLIKRNEMVESTASALRTGCKKVLDVEDDPSTVDLRTADIDDIIRRFRNRWRGQIKDRSIDQYEQRFRQSVDMYLKWLVSDPSWRPTRQAPRATTNGTGVAPTKKPASRSSSPAAVSGSTAAAEPEDAPSGPTSPGMITYPLPIRRGVQGRLVLPEDLSKKEAQRIANFVAALAFDERLAITAGESGNGNEA